MQLETIRTSDLKIMDSTTPIRDLTIAELEDGQFLCQFNNVFFVSGITRLNGKTFVDHLSRKEICYVEFLTNLWLIKEN